MPTFGAYIPPLVRQTKTRIFEARAIRWTIEDLLHDDGATEGVKGVFTRE